MIKAKIGIVTGVYVEQNPILFQINKIYVNSDYIEAIEKVNAIPIMLPVTLLNDILDVYINLCDGFIFTGGIDINPLYYNENPHQKLGMIDSKLDLFQLTLMKKILKSKKPFLAICRGLQILNVACGGTLYQDSSEADFPVIQHSQSGERFNLIHKVFLQKGSILYSLYNDCIYVNSFHHQFINRLGDNLTAIGHSPDNIIEAVEVKNYNFGLGVQWHPEMMLCHDNTMKKLFEEFIKSSLLNKKS